MSGRIDMQRRAFLAGLTGIAGASLARSTNAWCAGNRSLEGEVPRALVIVQLSGGNDGLDTVLPYGDDHFHELRGSLARKGKELHRIDRYRGLHPRLERLSARYQEGQVALVEGVGYPSPNRSHFKSLDIWHTARPRGRASGDGWIGRLCESMHGLASDPNRVVHVGRDVPYSLHSSAHPPVCFADPAAYRWVRKERIDEYDEEQVGQRTKEGSSLDFVRSVLSDARESSLAVRRAAHRYRPRVEYPANKLADELQGAAAILQGRIGAQVVSIVTGGFDTHADQKGARERLLIQLDSALNGFLDDLAGTEVGRNTLVLVFSEFGRRVAPNASGGTDHGTAGPVFLLGEQVRGGLYGEHPPLDELDEQGDLVHTTDFRSIYSTVVEGWFGARAKEVLGADYPKLRFLG